MVSKSFMSRWLLSPAPWTRSKFVSFLHQESELIVFTTAGIAKERECRLPDLCSIMSQAKNISLVFWLAEKNTCLTLEAGEISIQYIQLLVVWDLSQISWSGAFPKFIEFRFIYFTWQVSTTDSNVEEKYSSYRISFVWDYLCKWKHQPINSNILYRCHLDYHPWCLNIEHEIWQVYVTYLKSHTRYLSQGVNLNLCLKNLWSLHCTILREVFHIQI